METNQEASTGTSIPAEQPNQDKNTSKKTAGSSKLILRGALLGAAAGLILPLVTIIFRIIGCHYSLADFGDIISAAGMCIAPALLAGALLSAAAASLGESAGRRSDLRNGSTHRANRSAWIGTRIGMFLSLVIGAVFAIMLMFPDC